MAKDDQEICPIKSIQDFISSIRSIKGMVFKTKNGKMWEWRDCRKMTKKTTGK